MEIFDPMMCTGINVISILYPVEVGLHYFPEKTTLNSWTDTAILI